MVSVEGKREKERKCVAGGGKNWKEKQRHKERKEKGRVGLTISPLHFFFFKKVFPFIKNYLFIYLFIFGCIGSSFLCDGFL